jgi:hypothetical protein
MFVFMTHGKFLQFSFVSLVGTLALNLAESEFTFTEFGAADAVFGGAFFQFDFLFIKRASLFVGRDLVKFPEFIG